jgi:hypothetical protein
MLAGAAAAPSGAAAAAAPIVSASVATKAGTLIGPVAVRAKQTTIKVGGRRCTVGAGTPLAALIALKAKAKAPSVGRLGLKDYGSCGKRPSTSSLLYLTAIGADRADGPDGWVYDIAGRSGSTGAADPSGPFGKGRLKAGAAVAWRWCRASTDPEGDCGDAYVIANVERAPLGAEPTTQQQSLVVTVRIRTGATAEQSGATIAAPAGVRVRLISGTQVLTDTVTAADGTATVHGNEVIAPGSRIVVDGSPTIAPTGRIWPGL